MRDGCRVARVEKNMNRKITVLTLCAVLLALSVSAEAQQATKISRIGYLGASSPTTYPARIEAFRQGLRELGYVEGKNIVVEYRYAREKRIASVSLRRS